MSSVADTEVRADEANPPEAKAVLAGENLIVSGSTEALAALRARA